MKIDILKHTIVNVCKSITYGMKKPDKKFFRTSLESMMEHQTTVLSRMGDTTERSAAKTLKYLSYHLGKKIFQDLSLKVFHLLARFIGDISPDTCICFDSVDINKYSARQMEDLRKVRDGSTGNIVNGYVLNAVSIKGIPLLMERELLTDTEGTELTTRYDIFETQVQKIQSQFGSGSWILADRLYDDVKKYNLLLTEGFRFAIRMKTSRYVTMESILSGGYRETETGAIETGDQIQISQKIQVADLPEGHYKITFPGLQRACFLTVTLKKGMKNPIRVLSSESDTGTVLQYLKRWEIERIFKTGKQELELESIGTKSKHKIDHLIVLVQLSLGISAHIYNRLHEQLITEEYSGKIVKMKAKYLALEGYNVNNKKAVVDATAFVKNMKRYLARVSKTFNRNSIICFIGDYMKKVRKIYWNLEKVTQKPQLSAQLSLGF